MAKAFDWAAIQQEMEEESAKESRALQFVLEDRFMQAKSPEDAAESLDLIRRSGMKQFLTSDQQDEVKRRLQIRDFPAQTIASKPELKEWMQDPNKAALASQDVDKLILLHQQAKELVKQGLDYQYGEVTINGVNVAGTRGFDPESGRQALDRAMEMAAAEQARIDADAEQLADQGWIRATFGAGLYAGFKEDPNARYEHIQQARRMTEASAAYDDSFMADLFRGLGQFTSDIPQYLLGGAMARGPQAMAQLGALKLGFTGKLATSYLPGAVGAATANQAVALPNAIRTNQERGAQAAITEWAVETLVPGLFGSTGTERVLLGALAKQQTGEAVSKIAGRMLLDAGLEATEEATTELVHAYTEYLQGDEDALNMDALGRRLAVAGALGSVASTVFQAPQSVQQAFLHQRIQSMEAIKTASQLEQVANLAKSTKVAQLDPQSMQELLEKTTLGAEVYFQSTDWDNYWLEQGEDPQEIADELGIGEIYRQAQMSGAAFPLNTGRVINAAATREGGMALLDLARNTPSAQTRKEALEALERADDEVNQELLEAAAQIPNDPVLEGEPGQQVYNDVYAQAIGVGADEAYAQHLADLHRSVFTNLAERAGVDPVELYQSYGLTIRRMSNEELMSQPEPTLAQAVERTIPDLIQSYPEPIRAELQAMAEQERAAQAERGVQDEAAVFTNVKMVGDLLQAKKVLFQSDSMPTITLFRASNDDFARVGTSFAESRTTAEAYTDNPGFGGATIYRTAVNPRRVLDLTNVEDAWQALSEASGLELDPATYGHHFARVLPTDDTVAEALAGKGYDWVRFVDDFPEGAITYIPVSEDAAEEAYQGLEEDVPEFEQRQDGAPTLAQAVERTIPDLIQAKRVLFQSAYHGTGFSGSLDEFGRFRTDMINSEFGEGAQAFGFGLYFTSARSIAEDYRKKLGKPQVLLDGRVVPADLGLDTAAGAAFDALRRAIANVGTETATVVMEATARLTEQAESYADDPSVARFAEIYRKAARMVQGTDPSRLSFRPAGRIASVEIPDSSDLLQWDKTLSEHPQKIQDKVRSIGGMFATSDFTNLTVADLVDMAKSGELAPVLRRLPDQDQALTAMLDKQELERSLSYVLQRVGIPGLEYPARSLARFIGVQTDDSARNFVIWDDNLINIREFEQRQDGAKRGAISFTDGKTEIILTENANLSTLLHESGHLFLEMLADLAEQNQSQQVQEIWQAAKDFLGVQERAQIGTDQHEKWATGFEHYLRTREGSPSKRMNKAFAAFRSWLSVVYGKLKGLVKLDPQVVQMFDRVIATDSEIAQMAQGVFVPLSIEASTDPEEQKRYLEAISEANRQAQDELRYEALKEEERTRRQWYLDQKAKVQEEVTQEVDAKPVYQSLRWLQDGVTPATMPEGVEPFRLNRQEIITQFGEPTLWALPGNTSSPKRTNKRNPGKNVYDQDGVSLAFAANALGYDSPNQLITDLQTAADRKQVIKTLTEARMLERYGDMRLDGRIHQLALKAIENDGRARVLEMEVKKLSILTGTKPSPRQVLKLLAERQIHAMTVKDIRPNVYRVAMDQARKRAFEAANRGDNQAALLAKQQEMLNHYLFRSATEALETVEKAARYIRQLEKTSIQQKVGKASQNALLVANFLGERYEFKKVTNKELKLRSGEGRTLADMAYMEEVVSALEALNEEAQALGIALDVPAHLIGRGLGQNYRNLPFTDVTAIRDVIKQIRFMATRFNHLLTQDRQATVEQIVTEAVEHGYANAKKISPPPQELRTFWQNIYRDFISKPLAAMRRMGSILYQADGGQMLGPLQRALNEPATKAAVEEQRKMEAAQIRLAEIIRKRFPKGSNPEASMVVPGLNESWTHMGRIMVGMNYGNESSRDRVHHSLSEGGKFDGQARARAILDTLTAEDLTFIQEVIDHFESYWPEVGALEVRVQGLKPEKVQAVPIQTPAGEIPGGYFPIKYEGQVAAMPTAFEELSALATQRSFMTKHGHTKAREAAVKADKRLRWDFGVILEGTYQVIHDLTHREMLIDASRLLKHDTRINKMLQDTVGPALTREVQDTFVRMGQGEMASYAGNEAWARSLRRGAAISSMAWGTTTALQQPLGSLAVVPRVGLRNLISAYKHFTGPQMLTRIKEIQDKSEFMSLRGSTFLREAREYYEQLSDPTQTSAVRKLLTDGGFHFLAKFQMLADFPVWQAAYEKYTADGFAEADAIAAADKTVGDTQMSGLTKDLPRVLAAGGDWWKMFTMYGSFFTHTYNLIAEQANLTDLRSPKAVAKLATDLFWLISVPATLGYVIIQGLKGNLWDDDKDDEENIKGLAKKIGVENVLFIFAMFPGLREFSSAGAGYAGYQGPGGMRAAGEFGKAYKEITDDDLEGRDLQLLNRVGGTLFHYPSTQLERVVMGLNDWAESDEFHPFAPLVGPPVK